MTLSLGFSAAALLIGIFSFIGLLRYIRLRTGAKHILGEVEQEVNRLVADIDAVTDRDITLLEDKSAAIKAMLETLDRRLATYARELERREKQEAALNALGSGARKPGTEDAYVALGRGLRSSLRVDTPEPPASASSGPAEPPGPASSAPSVEPVPEDSSPEPRFIRSANPVKPRASLSEQAQELYRSGFSPETIAVRLGVTVAEVNLALALANH
jgi:hypothetical protein